MNWRKILLVVGFVALLLGLLFLTSKYSFEKEESEALKVQRKSQTALQEIVEKRVLYIIDKGEGSVLQYQVTPLPGSTVFSLLQDLSKKENFEISFKNYPEMGVFVKSIAGLENGTNGKYWQYWMNGKFPMVAADKMEVKGGDVVEWKFEKSQF